MQNTDLIPICSDKNKYFQKENDKVIVYNTITENSMIMSKQAVSVLLSLDGKTKFIELQRRLPKIEKKALQAFLDTCINQGFAYYTKSESHTSEHIPIIKDPENLLIIKCMPVRILIYIMILLSPVFLISYYILDHNFVNESKNIVNIYSLEYIPFWLLSLIMSICFHEIAHAIFAKTFGVNVCEISIKFKKTPPFFKTYVSMCGISYVEEKWKKMLIYSAGFLAHLLIISAALYLTTLNISIVVTISKILIIINTIMIFLNIIPIYDSDGSQIFKIMFKP